MRSPPTWGRGLKLYISKPTIPIYQVAPHVGAWIETRIKETIYQKKQVAPHVGAWIETLQQLLQQVPWTVAPHVGAWIETLVDMPYRQFRVGRPPRGGVD